MAKKPSLKVVRESKTGLNTHFETSSGEILTRGQVADKIGEFPGYHVAKVDGKRVIRSNPDGNKSNNLD